MALYPNGRAPSSALVEIYGCVASPDMARRVKYVKDEYDRTHGDNLSINEIYRTFDEQVRQKDRWTDLGQPGNAATPGYSNHGAWDVGAVDWSSIDIDGRREIAARVGLIHNIPNESWHAAAVGPINVPLPSLAGLNITEIPEDDMYDDKARAELVKLLETITAQNADIKQWLLNVFDVVDGTVYRSDPAQQYRTPSGSLIKGTGKMFSVVNGNVINLKNVEELRLLRSQGKIAGNDTNVPINVFSALAAKLGAETDPGQPA